MKPKKALKAISIISLIGILFAGYLTFSELALDSCPIGGCSELLGLPVCIYGLVMYIIVFTISIMGQK